MNDKIRSAPEGSSVSAAAQAPASRSMAEKLGGHTTRLVPTERPVPQVPFQEDPYRTDSGALPNNPDPMIGQFASFEDDYVFQSLLELGWESLDTVGLPQEGGGLYHFQA